jgi:hypothetical protein
LRRQDLGILERAATSALRKSRPSCKICHRGTAQKRSTISLEIHLPTAATKMARLR